MTSDPVADLLASNFIVLDFETYYASDYTLSKMTTADYIRDPRFETIGVGVIAPGFKEPRWFEHAEFVDWARSVDWSSAVVLAHHSHFDGLICGHHYRIRPGYWLDTLSMARALHPAAEVGGSLSKLMAYYKVGQKGDEVVKALGKRRRDFTTDEWLRYGEYCKNDCLGTLGIFVKMAAGFPIAELDAIDTTIRMFTEPEFRIDEPMLQKYLLEEQDRKKMLLESANSFRDVLMSNPRFAGLLLEMGVTPPRKVSKRTGEETFAFAKSDPGMQALLEHDDDAVRALAEARIGVKSTINETRTERLLRSGRSGAPVPVYLKYYGAHTGRWSGGDRMNFQNFTRGGTMRKALLAPEGSVIVVADSSQIEARITAWLAGQEHLVEAFRENRDVYSEFASSAYGRTITKKDETERFVGKVCWAEGTPVLTRRGLVPIETVTLADEVWDGIEWVSHSGLLDQGEKEVWESNSVAATPDHEILTERGWRAWSEVLTSPSLFQSALSSANLPCCDGNGSCRRAGAEDFSRSSDATAGGKDRYTGTTCCGGAPPDATGAPSSPPPPSAGGSIRTSCPTTNTDVGCSTGLRLVSVAAQTPRINRSSTTAGETSKSRTSGETIGPHSFCTCSSCRVGTSPTLNWTVSTQTETTLQEMSGSSLAPKTPPTGAASPTLKRLSRTYDIASCGPRSRFTILSASGPLIVHNCVLGLGYGMGWYKLAESLAAGSMGGKKIVFTEQLAQELGVSVGVFAGDPKKMRFVDAMPSLLPLEARTAHCAVAEFFVQRYRRENHRIPELWKMMDDVLHMMLDDIVNGGIVFKIRRHAIELPNGLRLRYPGLEDEDGSFSYMGGHGGKERVKIYGGLLTENVVQALARIVVTEQMQALREKFGYKVVLMTHDEIVCSVPEAQGEEALKNMLDVMKTPPTWAPGLPVSAEGGWNKSYGKAKK